jgi:hypothetical protein
VATHTDPPRRPPDEAWAHWEAPYADSDDPGAIPPPPYAGGPMRGAGGPRLDFQPLFMLLEAVRRGVPRELEDQFNALVREILMTLRALIDWYLERLERRPAEPRVEDIPIE